MLTTETDAKYQEKLGTTTERDAQYLYVPGLDKISFLKCCYELVDMTSYIVVGAVGREMNDVNNCLAEQMKEAKEITHRPANCSFGSKSQRC